MRNAKNESKPCPRCEGIEVTWGNVRLVHFCDQHLGEAIRSIAPYPKSR